MEFITIIEDYLKTAPIYELNRVDIILGERLRQVPEITINPALTRQAIINKATELFDGTNKLYVVKFFKDMTGMGLKDSKDWCDIHIFNKVNLQNQQG